MSGPIWAFYTPFGRVEITLHTEVSEAFEAHRLDAVRQALHAASAMAEAQVVMPFYSVKIVGPNDEPYTGDEK